MHIVVSQHFASFLGKTSPNWREQVALVKFCLSLFVGEGFLLLWKKAELTLGFSTLLPLGSHQDFHVLGIGDLLVLDEKASVDFSFS